MQKYVFDGAENNRKRNMLTQQILLELFSVFFSVSSFFSSSSFSPLAIKIRGRTG